MLRILKKPPVILVLGALAVAAFFGYLATQPPAGTEVKGAEAGLAWASLATAVVSLLTSVVGLVMKLLELRSAAAFKPPQGE